jgi:hypothetical protein
LSLASADLLLGLLVDPEMEVVCSSETSGSLLIKRRYNPEDDRCRYKYHHHHHHHHHRRRHFRYSCCCFADSRGRINILIIGSNPIQVIVVSVLSCLGWTDPHIQGLLPLFRITVFTHPISRGFPSFFKFDDFNEIGYEVVGDHVAHMGEMGSPYHILDGKAEGTSHLEN